MKKNDAKNYKCTWCKKQADKFVFIIFKPSLSNKPFCNKCIKKIEKMFF